MSSIFKVRLRHAAVFSASLLASWGASAAEAAQSAATIAQPSEQLQEITVTANRRVENNQAVPIAITAVTADTASKFGIANALTLGESIPNLVFNRQSNGSIPFIRGVGNPNSTPGDEPSVAIYVDDVYMPLAGSGISNFSSIDRLEVEKGPQGTLFGRNATGGVVQVYTRNPSATETFDASIGYANYQTASGSIYASGGTEKFSANVAVYGGRQYQGWGRNLVNGEPTFGDEYNFGGRVKFLYTPNDRMNFLLTLDHDTTGTGIGLTYRAADGTLTTDSPSPGVHVPGASAPSPANFFDIISNFQNHSNNYQSGVSLKATFDLNWASLVSITAYRNNNDQEYFDLDAGPAPLFNTYLHGQEKTWTQEFRLLSPAGSPWQWIAGLYYFGDKAGYLPINFNTILVSSFGEQTTHSYAAFGQVTKEIMPNTNLTVGLRYTTDRRSASNYNTSTIQQLFVTPTTNVVPICPTLGPTFFNPVALACAGGTGSESFSKVSGKISLDHRFNDDFMAYVAYNRGFKSGLFNVVSIFAPIDEAVKPETLDAVSIGEKAEFLDHRLRINAEAFYYKFKNIQVQSVVNGTSHASNAAKATLKGLEIDVTAVPVEHLTLTGSIGVEEGKFDEFPDGAYVVYDPVHGGNCALSPTNTCGLVPGGPGAPPGYNGTSWSLAGNKTPNTPPFSASLSAKYDIPTRIGPFDLNLAWNHTGNYYFSPDNGQGQVAPSQPSFNKQKLLDIINASIGWTSESGHMGVRLWGKNISDVHYLAFGIETSNLTSWSAAPPRTFGITLSSHF